MEDMLIWVLAVILAVGLLPFLGYRIARRINAISRAALVIAITAAFISWASLLHSTSEILHLGIPSTAYTPAHNDNIQVCSLHSSEQTLCLKEITYRGFPSTVLKTEHLSNGDSITNVTGYRGSAIVPNYMFYFAGSALVAFVLLRPTNKKTSEDDTSRRGFDGPG